VTQLQQSIVSNKAETPSQDEAALWARFADANPAARPAFCQTWLALQCSMLPDVTCGMLLLGEADNGPFETLAVWPSVTQDISALKATAERSLAERRGLMEPIGGKAAGSVQIAYPIEVLDRLYGVVVLELTQRTKAQLQGAFRRLHWGIAWIELLIRRGIKETDNSVEQENLALMVELVACVVEEPKFQGAAMAFATELATALGCDRVSLGLYKGHRIRVKAISHSADFGKHMNLVRAIEGAMEEAFDQQTAVLVPAPDQAIPLVTRAHETLRAEHGGGAVCSVPFAVAGEFAGAICLERYDGRAFDGREIGLAEGVAELVGPVLIGKWRDDRWLPVKAADSAREHLGRLFGPRHLGYKLVGVTLGGLIAFFSLVEAEYRVGADALLEGAIQRVMVSPQQGYLATAAVRAGDLVNAGQVMATLDDRDLELERLKFSSEREQYLKEYRSALAARDPARVKILGSQIRQVEAELALTQDRLARLKLEAPFDGLVVSGDLSQSLGAAVERGEVLFEVAPLDGYRVVLQVDERQVGDVKVGQQGVLALTGMPSDKLPFTIEKITPVATAAEGRNYFRVEAALADAPEILRPGMEGVGKIDVDQRRLIWIWTRELMNWLRLRVWSWWP
jgi:multidrug resistance efflux pump